MALLGMNVVLLRALKDSAGLDGTVVHGVVWMVLLGAVGWIVGAIAQTTVDESVRIKIEAELAAVNAPRQEAAKAPSVETT